MSAWPRARLGDVCQTGAGGTPLSSKKEYYEGGTIPWLVSGEVVQGQITTSANCITALGLEKSSARIFPENTVLVAMYGATAGQVGILRFRAATNQAICGILPNDRFIPEFLYYLLLSKKQELIAQAAGNAQPNISQIKIKNTTIPVPALPEQQRLVTILDQAFAGLATATANTEKNLKNARELFDSYLNAVFEQKGEGWQATTLGSEVDLLVGFAFKSSQYTKSIDGIRLLRGDNIIQNALRWDEVKRWPATDIRSYESYNLEVGDVVLAMDRTWVKAGLKYAVIEETDTPCLLVQRVARLRCRNGLARRFLVHLIGGPQFTRYVLGIQTGLSVPHISGKQISDFVFWKPRLLEQQKLGGTIDDLASKVARLEETYNEKLLAIEDLRQSVLQQAFSGELTTPPSQAIKEAAE
jgi:type I restriction enzyme S subunit